MTPDQYNVYSGPPGTGKTTCMMALVSDALEQGIDPSAIGYLSFTTAAADEAVNRASARFRMQPKRLKWFRTIHSLCFRALELTTDRVFGRKYEKECARAMGLRLSSSMKNVLDFGGTTLHDRALFLFNLSRVTMQSPKDLKAERGISTPLSIVDRIAEDFQKFKDERDLVDFNDMLYRVAADPSVLPTLDTLIIDEAQDLSPLQWRVIELLAQNTQAVHIAGDDDQAIYAWAGADVDYFIDLKGPSRVLNQSHRLPRTVHRVAEWVSSRIAVRRPKTWAPRDEDGEVTILRNPVFLREAMRKDRGRWMFLVRNRYLLAKYEKLAQGLGVYYRVKSGTSYTNSLGAKLRDAIVAWQELTTGESLSLRQALNLLKFMDSAKAAETKQTMLDGKDGDKDVVYFPAGQWPDWEEALNRIPPTKVGYIRRMLARGENLFSEPQTTIATIHSVKGGEADNVVVDLEMARTSWQEMRRAPDNEHRVWYVGFTRAKQRLYIVQSGSQYSYSVGGLHERELVAAGAVA